MFKISTLFYEIVKCFYFLTSVSRLTFFFYNILKIFNKAVYILRLTVFILFINIPT
nr:MAG TPA_asm: hypothetical protein [Bacteriophage sp.]